MQVTYGHALYAVHVPGKPISLDVMMLSAPSHEIPTKEMMDKAGWFKPLLMHAEEVFERDDNPFLKMIAEHRIPAECTPQQLSGHLTFIDARWKTLAMRPLPPAHHPHSVLSHWRTKAASPSSSALVKQLAKRQLLGKLLELPDTDAFKGHRPISSSCASGPMALKCAPMHHDPACRDPMFCPANRAVSLTFTYPNHTTNLRAQFELRESLRAERPKASAAAPGAAAVALGASAAAPGASAVAPASSRKRSAAPASAAAPGASASKRPKQGGSKTRKSISKRRRLRR
jgi:hypothetical protein